MERLYKVSKLLGFPASLLQLLESGKRWWAMGVKSVRKTVKLKLIPLSKSDRREPYSLLEEFTSMVREALNIIIGSGVRSRGRARELCYRPLREKHLHNKLYESGLGVAEADARRTSTDRPVCRHSDRGNRLSKETFKCRKCNFTFNAQHVAYLNLYTRPDDGSVAIRSGVLVLAPRKAGPAVPVNVALRWATECNEVAKGEARALSTGNHF